MIYVTGEIEEDKFSAFDEAMRDSEKSKSNIIDIVLHSTGGCAYTAIAYHDRIRNSPKDVRITVYGSCMSAAVLILAAGGIRRMSKNSWVMVHEDEPVYDENARVSDIEKAARHGRRLEDQWDALLEQTTGTTASHWRILHKAETYLLADECKELGLIEEIV